MHLSAIDQAAVAIMLAAGTAEQKQAALDCLLKQSAVVDGQQCEKCESLYIEDNGARRLGLTFCCTDCGYQWSPNI